MTIASPSFYVRVAKEIRGMFCPSEKRQVNFASIVFAHGFLSIGKAASFKILGDCYTVHLRPNIDVKTMRRIYRYPTKTITMILLDRLAKALKGDASELVESIPDDE